MSPGRWRGCAPERGGSVRRGGPKAALRAGGGRGGLPPAPRQPIRAGASPEARGHLAHEHYATVHIYMTDGSTMRRQGVYCHGHRCGLLQRQAGTTTVTGLYQYDYRYSTRLSTTATPPALTRCGRACRSSPPAASRWRPAWRALCCARAATPPASCAACASTTRLPPAWPMAPTLRVWYLPGAGS